MQEYDLAALTKLCADLDIPVAAGEWVYGGAHVAATMLTQGAADIIRGDAIVSGGITGLVKTARVAEALGAHCEVHERGPGFGHAHAQVLGALSNCEFFEFNAVDPQAPTATPFLQQTLRVENGEVIVPDGPGLGLEPDWDEIGRRTVEVI